MKYNERGEELPDDTPIELPVRFKRPPSLQEQIKAMVRTEYSRVAEENGFESFEESDDFEVDDDNEIRSVHELSPMQEEVRYAKPDKSVLDKRDGKEDDGDTVNKDRKPEVADGGRKDGEQESDSASDRSVSHGVADVGKKS